MQAHRQIREAPHKVRSQSKKLQFLRALFASAQHTQIFHFTARWRLREAQGIAEKCKVRFTKKCGNHADDQCKKQPWRKEAYAECQAGGGNNLLDQTTCGLNHQHAVRALHAGPFQFVLEGRIFIRSEVQPRRVLHNADADVLCVLVGKDRIAIVGEPD